MHYPIFSSQVINDINISFIFYVLLMNPFKYSKTVSHISQILGISPQDVSNAFTHLINFMFYCIDVVSIGSERKVIIQNSWLRVSNKDKEKLGLKLYISLLLLDKWSHQIRIWQKKLKRATTPFARFGSVRVVNGTVHFLHGTLRLI